MSRTAIVWAWMVREGVPWPPGAVPGASHGWQGQGQGNSRRTAPRPSWPSCRVRPWGTVPLLYGCLDGPGGCPSPGMEPRPCVLPSPGHCLGCGAVPPRQAAIACASLSARAGAVCGLSARSNRAAVSDHVHRPPSFPNSFSLYPGTCALQQIPLVAAGNEQFMLDNAPSLCRFKAHRRPQKRPPVGQGVSLSP